MNDVIGGRKRWAVPVLRMRFPYEYRMPGPDPLESKWDRFWESALFVILGAIVAGAIIIRG